METETDIKTGKRRVMKINFQKRKEKKTRPIWPTMRPHDDEMIV